MWCVDLKTALDLTVAHIHSHIYRHDTFILLCEECSTHMHINSHTHSWCIAVDLAISDNNLIHILRLVCVSTWGAGGGMRGTKMSSLHCTINNVKSKLPFRSFFKAKLPIVCRRVHQPSN